MDRQLLEREKQSTDFNAVRALERMEKTKKVLEDNNRLTTANIQMGDNHNRAMQKNRMQEGMYGKDGDIFDSMFERQNHWRKVGCSEDSSMETLCMIISLVTLASMKTTTYNEN